MGIKAKPKLEYSRNDTISFAHECRARDLRSMIAHFKKWEMDAEEIIEFLEEVADQSEAQAIVVDLRDKL